MLEIIISYNPLLNKFDTIAYLLPNQREEFEALRNYLTSYKDIEQDMGLTIADMVSLYEASDDQQRIRYLAELTEKRLNDIQRRLPNFQEVTVAYMDKYSSFKALRTALNKKLKENGEVELPPNVSVQTYLYEKHSEGQKKFPLVCKQYLDDFKSSANLNVTMTRWWDAADDIHRFFESAGLCSCCGLPYWVPFCGCNGIR